MRSTVNSGMRELLQGICSWLCCFVVHYVDITSYLTNEPMKEPTRFVEQSPWEARSSSVRQEYRSTCNLWHPKVYYHACNRPPLVPVLSQINPGHALISFSFKIHFTMILQCTSWFYKWCLSFRFPLLPCMCHLPCPFHPPWVDHLNIIWWVAQIMKLLKMYFFYVLFFRPS